MNFVREASVFPSSDGKHMCEAILYMPSGAARGAVQIAHGMAEHIGRYEGLFRDLAEAGYVVAGASHLGHGNTAASQEELGFFGEGDGEKFLLADLYKVNKQLRRRFPTLPVALLGHSMGSFLARLYAVEKPDSIDALILHGTGGSNPLLPLGKLTAYIIEQCRGGKHRSGLLRSLAFSGYNSHFKGEGEYAWLSRRPDVREAYEADPLCGFTFTVSAYRALFRMVGASNSKDWYGAYPKSLPVLIMSGEEDPVGNYGRGPRQVYKRLLLAGAEDVTLKTYAGARHELLQEENTGEVVSDMLAWLSEKLIGASGAEMTAEVN